MGVGGDRDFLTLSGEMCLTSLNQRSLSPKESHWILLKMQIPRASPKDSDSGGQVPESVMGPISTETAERVEKHGRGTRRSCHSYKGTTPRALTSLVLHCHQLNATHNLDGV